MLTLFLYIEIRLAIVIHILGITTLYYTLRGLIIYFFDGKSPSRYKQKF